MGSFYAGVAMIVAFAAIILAMVIYAMGLWLGLGVISVAFFMTALFQVGMHLMAGVPL